MAPRIERLELEIVLEEVVVPSNKRHVLPRCSVDNMLEEDIEINLSVGCVFT